MIRTLFLAIPILFMRSIIPLFAFQWVFFASAGAASACTPVVYLFRHAEDKNEAKTRPFDVTLTASGLAHADLYVAMMNTFEQQTVNCPISTVYALNPKKFATGPDIGTSNPYWTANPLAQETMGRNPIIEVKDMRLTELLPDPVGAIFVGDIKDKLGPNDQSAAIFWTSDGMCAVARILGPGLPGYTCTQSSKPKRNWVFQFLYNRIQGVFEGPAEYQQCFNYNKNTHQFVSGAYYCNDSGNLEDFKNEQGFWDDLNKIAGRIEIK